MARWLWILAPVAMIGCSTPSTGSPQPEPVYYEGNVEGCTKVEEVCLSTEPPQCFDFCADAPPKSGSPCSGEGDVRECGDSTCIVAKDEQGNDAALCVSPDCTISYDAATGQETISCPTSDGGLDDGAPGFTDGSSGGS